MVLIKENLSTVSIAERETVKGVWTVEAGLVFKSGVPTLRGTYLNDLSPLWPMALLRDELMTGAKKFVADLGKQGLRLFTPEAQIRVYGPLKARGWRENGTAEEVTRHHVRGNSLVVPKALGRTEFDNLYPSKCDFILMADFIATRGYENDAPLVARG